jgi:hypothetical protein
MASRLCTRPPRCLRVVRSRAWVVWLPNDPPRSIASSGRNRLPTNQGRPRHSRGAAGLLPMWPRSSCLSHLGLGDPQRMAALPPNIRFGALPWHLTLLSSGRSPTSCACLRPPLISNVKRHRSHAPFVFGISAGAPWDRKGANHRRLTRETCGAVWRKPHRLPSANRGHPAELAACRFVLDC